MATVNLEADQHVMAEIIVPVDQNETTVMKNNNSNPVEHHFKVKTSGPIHGLVYAIEDMPPWYITIVLGLQHFMTDFGSNVSTVFILAPYLCISHDAVTMGKLLGTMFFVSGMVSILQTTCGVRLPIIQGTTVAFLIPTFSILSLRGECPPVPTVNSTTEELSVAEDEWLARIREIQGAIMVASCVQVIIGATGIVGILMNFIGPLTVTPTITLIGLSLHKTAAAKSGSHWGISFMTIVLIALFSQYLPEFRLPLVSYKSSKKCHVTRVKLFKMFPIILGIAVAWLLSYIFTVTGVFPDDPTEYGYSARTDLKSDVLNRAPWISFPYPGQWGTPTVTMSGVLGIVAGILASIIESIGDYYACARMTGAPPLPQHAINRGILMEGIGCVLAGAWGSGNGTTSHSEHIGAIGLTKVGSRVVIQVAGCLMMVTGILNKLVALFATIPEPVIGGVLCVTFGMVTAVGLSNLQYVDLNSSRNLFILGFSTLMGLAVPYYTEENPNFLKTGSLEVDQILMVMLSTGMFIGGFLGILLDNTIPGTDEERGFLAWRQHTIGAEDKDEEVQDVEKDEEIEGEPTEQTSMQTTKRSQCYDLPFGMRFIRRWAWCRYLPFSPTFEGFNCSRMKICKKNRY